MVYYNSPTAVRELSQRTVRRPVARVRIEWTGAVIDPALNANSEDKNRVTYPEQVYDGNSISRYKWFHLYNDNTSAAYNNLRGDFHPMPNHGNNIDWQVGWRGAITADASGSFNGQLPSITVNFTKRYFRSLIVAGDSILKEYPVDFVLKLYSDNTLLYSETINAQSNHANLSMAACRWDIDLGVDYPNTNSIKITVNAWSRPNTFVKITEALSGVGAEYSAGDIVSLSLLEETESSGGTLPVGNISCNEMDLVLENIDNKYFPFNEDSYVHTHLTRNRKTVPFVGFIDSDGDEHLIPKGLYWSGEWNVSEQDSGASTSAQDRLAQFQNIEYNGIYEGNGVFADGYSSVDNQDAEYTYWHNITPYDLMHNILSHIRANSGYGHPDLEFDIDPSLSNYQIEYAFFAKQSYFDIIKSIAQVSMAYAYMDTPTDVEVDVAAEQGNVGLRDILRVRNVREALLGNAANDITISARDYLTRTHPENSAELANYATVLYHKYEIVDGRPKEVEGFPQTAIVESSSSIERLGIAKYEYPDNNLIQDESVAKGIAGAIIDMFSETHRTQTLQTFGDPSLSILDRAIIPEFQKFLPRENRVDVLRRGIYAVKRIQTEYDGSLRQNIECRKVGDMFEYDEINETGVADMEIDESGTRADNIYEVGRA
jgi:hypothetical protein